MDTKLLTSASTHVMSCLVVILVTPGLLPPDLALIILSGSPNLVVGTTACF